MTNLAWFINDNEKFCRIGEELIKQFPELNKPENRNELFYRISQVDETACKLLGATDQTAELFAANLREEGIKAKYKKI